jgi:hypothetical protein
VEYGESELRDGVELHRDYYLIPEQLWEELLGFGVFQVDCDIATILTPVSYEDDENVNF